MAGERDVRDVIDVVDAFADGEPVDPDGLNAALALAEGRDRLIEILRLRDVMAFGLPIAAGAGSRRRTPGRGWVVAAVLALAAMGGFAGGRWFQGARSRAIAVTASAPAPAPTRVIRLQSGVDWTEQGGGGH